MKKQHVCPHCVHERAKDLMVHNRNWSMRKVAQELGISLEALFQVFEKGKWDHTDGE